MAAKAICCLKMTLSLAKMIWCFNMNSSPAVEGAGTGGGIAILLGSWRLRRKSSHIIKDGKVEKPADTPVGFPRGEKASPGMLALFRGLGGVSSVIWFSSGEPQPTLMLPLGEGQTEGESFASGVGSFKR